MKRRRGFTLIELLVVIGIIVVLIGILLPSLAGARKRAKTATCLANERALGQTFQLYLETWGLDSGNRVNMTEYWYLHYWLTPWDYILLNGGLNRDDWGKRDGTGGAIDKLRFCPETTKPAPARLGGAGLAWDINGIGSENVYRQSHTGSYAFNAWFYKGLATEIVPGIFDRVQRWGDRPEQKWPERNRQSAPVFVDAVFPEIRPESTDAVPSDLADPLGREAVPPWSSSPHWGQLGNACTNRHLMAVNVVFLDGHAQTVKLPDLWTLKWSGDWTRATPAVVPGPGK